MCFLVYVVEEAVRGVVGEGVELGVCFHRAHVVVEGDVEFQELNVVWNYLGAALLFFGV